MKFIQVANYTSGRVQLLKKSKLHAKSEKIRNNGLCVAFIYKIIIRRQTLIPNFNSIKW